MAIAKSLDCFLIGQFSYAPTMIVIRIPTTTTTTTQTLSSSAALWRRRANRNSKKKSHRGSSVGV
eukprot:scaffold11428_cov105-Isochrysis_galbana.AAC.10